MRIPPRLARPFESALNDADVRNNYLLCKVSTVGRDYFLATDDSNKPLPLVAVTSGGCSLAFTNGVTTRYLGPPAHYGPAVEPIFQAVAQARRGS